MGPKVFFGVQKWVFGCKSGSKPTFHPLQTHFGTSAKTPLLTQFKGVEIVGVGVQAPQGCLQGAKYFFSGAEPPAK